MLQSRLQIWSILYFENNVGIPAIWHFVLDCVLQALGAANVRFSPTSVP